MYHRIIQPGACLGLRDHNHSFFLFDSKNLLHFEIANRVQYMCCLSFFIFFSSILLVTDIVCKLRQSFDMNNTNNTNNTNTTTTTTNNNNNNNKDLFASSIFTMILCAKEKN